MSEYSSGWDCMYLIGVEIDLGKLSVILTSFYKWPINEFDLHEVNYSCTDRKLIYLLSE